MGKNEGKARIDRIQRKKDILRSWGIDESFVREYKNESFKTLADPKFRKSVRSKQLQLDKYNYLIGEGIDPGNIRKTDLRKSWNFLKNEFTGNDVFYGEKWLYIGWANRGDSDLDVDRFKSFSLKKLKELTDERMREAVSMPDDSAGFMGFPIMFWGTKDECKHIEKVYSKRGYDMKLRKFVSDSFQYLCNRNDWTKKEMAECILIIVSQTTNLKAVDSYRDFYYYTQESNLPFESIFNKDILAECMEI